MKKRFFDRKPDGRLKDRYSQFQCIKEWLEFDKPWNECKHEKVSLIAANTREWQCDKCHTKFRSTKGYTDSTLAMYYELLDIFCGIIKTTTPDQLIQTTPDGQIEVEEKIGGALREGWWYERREHLVKLDKATIYKWLTYLQKFWKKNGATITKEAKDYNRTHFGGKELKR
jgi:ribosomal protein L37AE/L43A